MYLVPGRVVLLALQHGEEALVDADVLLLGLHHPHALLAHLVDDAEDVHHVAVVDLLWGEDDMLK